MFKVKKTFCCDLCERDLDEDERFPMMFYPFTAEETADLQQRFMDLVPRDGIGSVLAGPLVAVAVPRGHRFEFCKGCVDGFMPMLDELKNKAFRRVLERMQKRATKKEEDPDRRPARSMFDPDEDDIA